MPINAVTKYQGVFFKLALLIVLGIIYALTLAPDITWANRGADGADLIAATYTGGVPHPSGYPTYMLLARLFQWLPIGALAFRTNLMSAVFGVATALLISDLAQRSLHREGMQGQLSHFIGFSVGLSFGLSPLFWSQAVITEVYTLHAFFMALILTLTPLAQKIRLMRRAGAKNGIWLDRLGGLIFGLALGNQLTVIFLLPVWLVFGMFNPDLKTGSDERKYRLLIFSKYSISFHFPKTDWRVIIRRLGWLLLGLLIYITIPMRARSGSPINWGSPVDLKGLWWLVSGQLYQDRVFSLAPEYILPRIRNWAGWLQTQFGLLGLILGFFGLWYGKPRYPRFTWITVWVFLAFSIFAVGYNSTDSYVLLLPVYMAFALWIGLGAATVFEFVAVKKPRSMLIPLSGLVLLLMIALNAWANYPDVDASQDRRAVAFAAEVLANAPQDAILFAHEDEDIFTLRYYTYALGQRPDLVILSEALITDWYRETMRQTYFDLSIPENNCYDCIKRDIIAINPRPVCDVVFDAEEILACQP